MKTHPAAISPNTLLLVNNLFAEKKWSKTEDNNEAWEGFCNILERAKNQHERDVILALSRQFNWFRFTSLPRLITPPFRRFLDTLPINTKGHVYLVPIIKREDYSKNKGVRLVAGTIRTIHSRYRSHNEFRISMEHTPDSLIDTVISPEDRIILFDDFIGSGGTVNDVLTELPPKIVQKSPQLSVLCMACHEIGLRMLTDRGIHVYYEHLEKRGISNNERLTDQEKEAFKTTMIEIERRLKVHKDFKFGWEQCEALISFEAAPNNTFPIYWFAAPENTAFSAPPFSRPLPAKRKPKAQNVKTTASTAA